MLKSFWITAFLTLFIYTSSISSTLAAEPSAQTSSSWRQLNLTPEQIQWLEQNPTLKLGIDKNFAPYDSINDKGETFLKPPKPVNLI